MTDDRSRFKPKKLDIVFRELEAIKGVIEEIVQRQIDCDARLTYILVKLGYAQIAKCDSCHHIVSQALENGVPTDNSCPHCGGTLHKLGDEEE